MDTVYLETSVISYLTSRPSREPVIAAHQEITRIFWTKCFAEYQVYVSPHVLAEAGRGDAQAAAERLRSLEGIEVLTLVPEVEELASNYFKHL